MDLSIKRDKLGMDRSNRVTENDDLCLDEYFKYLILIYLFN